MLIKDFYNNIFSIHRNEVPNHQIIETCVPHINHPNKKGNQTYPSRKKEGTYSNPNPNQTKPFHPHNIIWVVLFLIFLMDIDFHILCVFLYVQIHVQYIFPETQSVSSSNSSVFSLSLIYSKNPFSFGKTCLK